MPLRFTVDTRRHARTAAFVFTFALVVCPRAFAGSITDPAAFLTAIAALPGTASTLDFEGEAAGTTIPFGGVMGGITFTSSIGLDLIVSTGFATTSGANYLGVDDSALGGEEFFLPPTDLWEMSFANPRRAFGMYVISSDPLFAGDIRLVTAAGTVENSATEYDTLGDGGLVYFLGFVSDGLPFNEVQVRYGAGTADNFVYNVDDITTVTAVPVPEVSSLLLTTTGLAALGARWRSTRSRSRKPLKE